jgi:hypothetical protein
LNLRSECTDLFFIPYPNQETIPEGKLRGARMLRPLLEILGKLVTSIATFVDSFCDTGLLQL